MDNHTIPGGDQDNNHRLLRVIDSELDNPARCDADYAEWREKNEKFAKERGHNGIPLAPLQHRPGREPKEPVERQRRRERGEKMRERKPSLRDRMQIVFIKEHLARKAMMRGLVVSDARLQEIAEARWEKEVARWRRRPAPQNELIDLQERREREQHGDHRWIRHAAMRRTFAGQAIHDKLMGSVRSTGAPSQHELAVAVIQKLIYDEGPIVLRFAYQDFACTSVPLLEFAYDSPAVRRPHRRHLDTTRPISESAVRDAINGYWRTDRKTGERTFIKGILDRVDPAFIKDLLFEVYLEMVATGKWPNMGRAFSIDGTFVPARLLQQQSVSPDHERLLNGRMQDGDCAFGYHGSDKRVRGYNGLFACDPHAPVYAAAAQLLLANADEGTAAVDLTHDYCTRLHERAVRDGAFPLPDLAYSIGDRAFSRPDVCFDLVFRYGLHPVFPWKNDKHTAKWAKNQGVPICDSCGIEMRYRDAEGFVGPAERWKLGLKPGDDLRKLIEVTPGMRRPCIAFKCPGTPDKKCKRVTKVNVEDAPHIYTYLPHRDVHCPDRETNRYRDRCDLLANRNSSESLNSVMKYKCWGLMGAGATACVGSKQQMEWYTYGRLLAQGLRRLVTNNGIYKSVRDEAMRYDLHRPGTFEQIKAVRDSQVQQADAA